MRHTNSNPTSKYPILILLVFATTFLFINPANAQEEQKKDKIEALQQFLTPDGKGNITFSPGLRIQTRYDYNASTKNNDVFIRRLRLKGKGKVFDIANYYFEVKIDNAGRYNTASTAAVENAWLNFDVGKDVNIRVGFGDIPFSRNALTSDSKLLLMDRSLIKNAISAIGMSDNTVGVFVHGRPLDNRLSYAVGVFDNIGYESTTQRSDGVMLGGRVAYDFMDPPKADGYGDYRGSYQGQGNRLTLGANTAYTVNAQMENEKEDAIAIGADLFFNVEEFTMEAEYDLFIHNFSNSDIADITGKGYYLQAGYLFFDKYELALRYQELDPDDNIENDILRWTSLGVNYYIHGHNLKVQAEYIWKRGKGDPESNDLIQVQLQFDF